MKEKKNENSKLNIELTSIQINEEHKWEKSVDIKTKKRRKIFPTIVFALFILTLVTTALSVAKYATSYSSGKVASVKSNEFIWNCNLLNYPKTEGNKIYGQYTITKQYNSLSDAYIDFDLNNFVTADGVTNTNTERINYQISMSAGGSLDVVDSSHVSVLDQNLGMSAGNSETQSFKVIANKTDPGRYSGTIIVTSINPYEKVYEQAIEIELKDTYVGGNWENGKVIYVVHNGVVDRTIDFSYSDEISCLTMTVDGVTGTPTPVVNGSKMEVSVFVPAGKSAELTFIKNPGFTIAVSEINYTIN